MGILIKYYLIDEQECSTRACGCGACTYTSNPIPCDSLGNPIAPGEVLQVRPCPTCEKPMRRKSLKVFREETTLMMDLVEVNPHAYQQT